MMFFLCLSKEHKRSISCFKFTLNVHGEISQPKTRIIPPKHRICLEPFYITDITVNILLRFLPLDLLGNFPCRSHHRFAH